MGDLDLTVESVAVDALEVIYINAQVEKLEAERDLYRAQKRTAEAEAIGKEYETQREVRAMDAYNVFGEEKGIFTFYFPVVEDYISPFIHRLDAWSYRNEKAPITVIFNSPGGSVFDGFALYDFLLELRRRGHKLTTKCLGAAMSMGAVLLQAGDERVMSSNAFFLIHEVQLAVIGSYTTAQTKDQLELQQKIQGILIKQLAGRSTLTEEEISLKWHKLDWLMDANEALSLGFVDRIEG